MERTLDNNFIQMHGVNYSVKVGEEIKFYLLIKDMVANSMSTDIICPVITLRYTFIHSFIH